LRKAFPGVRTAAQTEQNAEVIRLGPLERGSRPSSASCWHRRVR